MIKWFNSLRDKGVPVDIVNHKQTITQPRSQGSLLPISRWWEMRLTSTNCTHIIYVCIPKYYLVTAMFGQGFEIKCIFFLFCFHVYRMIKGFTGLKAMAHQTFCHSVLRRESLLRLLKFWWMRWPFWKNQPIMKWNRWNKYNILGLISTVIACFQALFLFQW